MLTGRYVHPALTLHHTLCSVHGPDVDCTAIPEHRVATVNLPCLVKCQELKSPIPQAEGIPHRPNWPLSNGSPVLSLKAILDFHALFCSRNVDHLARSEAVKIQLKLSQTSTGITLCLFTCDSISRCLRMNRWIAFSWKDLKLKWYKPCLRVFFDQQWRLFGTFGSFKLLPALP